MTFFEHRRRMLMSCLPSAFYVITYSLNALAYASIDVHKGEEVYHFSDADGTIIVLPGDWIQCNITDSEAAYIHHNGELVASTQYIFYPTSDTCINANAPKYTGDTCLECGSSLGTHIIIKDNGYEIDSLKSFTISYYGYVRSQAWQGDQSSVTTEAVQLEGNFTIIDDGRTITEGSPYTATVSITSAHDDLIDVSITMGEETLDGTTYETWSGSQCLITIPEVTGNVRIELTAIDRNDWN